MKNLEEKFWEKVDKNGCFCERLQSRCWIWNGWKISGGYGKIKINGIVIYAHRFVWNITNGEIPVGILVCHKCDNPSCVNPEHLFLGTMKDNMQDKIKKGRGNFACGERNGSAKLCEKDVISIRDRYNQKNITQEKLAREYNVSDALISLIINYKNWSLLP
jgi:hypothetical protein